MNELDWWVVNDILRNLMEDSDLFDKNKLFFPKNDEEYKKMVKNIGWRNGG